MTQIRIPVISALGCFGLGLFCPREESVKSLTASQGRVPVQPFVKILLLRLFSTSADSGRVNMYIKNTFVR